MLTILLGLWVSTTGFSQLERVDPSVAVPSVGAGARARATESDTPPKIIDVRLAPDFAEDPVLIPGAVWLDPNDTASWASELSSETAVVVYCVKGKWVSQSVTKKLRDLGLDVAQLEGGIEAWKAAGEPTTPAKTP